ncbi:MAG: DNA polymerase III subunit delta [Deltaproteobacteria bacterium]
MDVQRAIDDALKGKLLPVYVIQGAEPMLVSRAIEALRKVTVGGGPRALSEDHYEAATTRPAAVIDACRMLPMLSKWRFVMVRAVDNWKADDHEQLLGYINAPTPSTVLVLLTDKLDGRTKFATALKKKNILFDAQGPSEREMVPWLEAEAGRRGTSFAPGAAASLVLVIGADLSAVSDALDRLLLFASGRAITEGDVDAVIATVRESSQFELPDAIADKNMAKALGIAHQLQRQRAAGLLVLAMVARQMRLLARTRDALDRGEDLIQALRVPPFVASKLAGQVKRWTPAQLSRALRTCARTDLRLKSGGGRDRDARAIEELVLWLVSDAPG